MNDTLLKLTEILTESVGLENARTILSYYQTAHESTRILNDLAVTCTSRKLDEVAGRAIDFYKGYEPFEYDYMLGTQRLKLKEVSKNAARDAQRSTSLAFVRPTPAYTFTPQELPTPPNGRKHIITHEGMAFHRLALKNDRINWNDSYPAYV